jgi:hypothetical protein
LAGDYLSWHLFYIYNNEMESVVHDFDFIRGENQIEMEAI